MRHVLSWKNRKKVGDPATKSLPAARPAEIKPTPKPALRRMRDAKNTDQRRITLLYTYFVCFVNYVALQ